MVLSYLIATVRHVVYGVISRVFQSLYRNYYSFSPETEFRKCIVYYFFLNISGVALLLNGLRSLRHVVYDVMSDVLTYIDFNTSDLILPKLELRYAFCLLSVASLSCIANLNVLLIFLVANLQNRALSLHGVVVLQPPGVGLQAVPTCRVALIGLSPLL